MILSAKPTVTLEDDDLIYNFDFEKWGGSDRRTDRQTLSVKIVSLLDLTLGWPRGSIGDCVG